MVIRVPRTILQPDAHTIGQHIHDFLFDWEEDVGVDGGLRLKSEAIFQLLRDVEFQFESVGYLMERLVGLGRDDEGLETLKCFLQFFGRCGFHWHNA